MNKGNKMKDKKTLTDKQKDQLNKIAIVRINKILKWHKKNLWFDISFVAQVEKLILDGKEATGAQFEGISNIYTKFNLEEMK